ncbi:MAG TPA: ABC transporter permease [Pyrinomonadaceae bacterium]|jgi:predicted permease
MPGRLKRRLRALLRRGEVDRELEEELRHHLDRETELNVRAGMSQDEARRAALRAFGGVEQARELCREARGVRMIQDFRQDVRLGLRGMWKHPGFTLAAVFTLALGIGANTAIFGVVEAVLLRPLPFAEQERLVVMWKRDLTADQHLVELSIPEFNDWRAESRSFESLAAMPTAVYGYGYVLTGRGEPVQVESSRVSAGFFSTLGARPALGRDFTADDDRPGAARVVVLSHRLWRERFDSDPHLLGRPITLNGTGFEVVGVMPADFQFPKGVDIWSALSGNAAPAALQNRQAVFLQAVGRLRPGATPAEAEAEMNTIVGRLASAYPETEAAGHRVVVTPLADYVFGSARLALWMLLAATGLLLAVACANVANLLLARSTSRRREVAIRVALGARRSRIVRQLLVESMLLAAAGGALGLLLAHWLMRLLTLVAPADIPRIEEAGVSMGVLAFTAGAALLTVLIFGLAPAVTASNVAPAEALGEGGARTAGGRRGGRLLGALVIAELAVTSVLLIGAGLVMRSFVNLQRVDAGFDTSNVLTFQLRLHGKKYPDAKAVREFYRQLTERLEARPGVLAAGAVLIRPLEGPIGWDVPYATDGQSPEDAKRNPVPNFQVVTPHYFRSVGIPLKDGREFTEHDDDEAPKAVIVSESMARSIFPHGASPVGQRVRLDPSDPDSTWHTVVGVVGDARYRDLKEPRWDVYVPYRQFAFPVRYVTVRTAADPEAFAETLRREVAALDPDQAVAALKTTSQLFSENVARPRFNTMLLGMLSALAALLAAVGVYGVLSYGVRQRTREIGIRLALGAQPRDVVRLVVRRGMALALAGVGCGLVIAAAATRLLGGLLYGVDAFDPVTFSLIPLGLTCVALLASYVPARRATKVNPTLALRSE